MCYQPQPSSVPAGKTNLGLSTARRYIMPNFTIKTTSIPQQVCRICLTWIRQFHRKSALKIRPSLWSDHLSVINYRWPQTKDLLSEACRANNKLLINFLSSLRSIRLIGRAALMPVCESLCSVHTSYIVFLFNIIHLKLAIGNYHVKLQSA